MNFSHDVLRGVLWTISSAVFDEFVLVLGSIHSQFVGSFPQLWGSWAGVDELFDERFVDRVDFKLTIRTKLVCYQRTIQTPFDREVFQMRTRERFPLLSMRGYIHFEEIP